MLFYDIISMGSNVPLFMYAICLVVGCKTSKSSPVISPKRKSFCCDSAQRISGPHRVSDAYTNGY